MAKKILYVEDNYLNYLLVKKVFKGSDVVVERAEDASVALEKLRKLKPDLILMDLHLPGMDGIELSAVIKEQDAYAAIPIIAISASSLPEDRMDADRAGFAGFIEKPLNIRNLKQEVEAILWPDGDR
jgi:two-component system cell cycle response regulator DivK